MTVSIEAHAEKEKRDAALSSVLAAVFLTALKLVVGLMTGSLGILAEAAHSGLDLVAALVTFFAVRIADRPPDKRYRYGYGRSRSGCAWGTFSFTTVSRQKPFAHLGCLCYHVFWVKIA